MSITGEKQVFQAQVDTDHFRGHERRAIPPRTKSHGGFRAKQDEPTLIAGLSKLDSALS